MPRKSALKCYFGCVTTGSFHSFPHLEEDRYNIWKEVLSDSTKERGDEYIFKNLRLCDNHFEKYYHSSSGRLTRNAVPSLAKCIRADTTSQSTVLPVPNEIVETPSQEHFHSETVTTGITTDSASQPTSYKVLQVVNHIPPENHNLVKTLRSSSYILKLLPVTNEFVESTKSQEYLHSITIPTDPLSLIIDPLKIEPRESKTETIVDLNVPTEPGRSGPSKDPEYVIKIERKESTTNSNNIYLNKTSVPVKRAHACVCSSEVRKLNLQIQKLKAKCKSLKKQVVQSRKMSLKREFLKRVERLPEPAKIFTNMQLSKTLKRPKGRRFTEDEKVLSLIIYKHSEKAYDLLEKMFTLPSKRTLQKIISEKKAGSEGELVAHEQTNYQLEQTNSQFEQTNNQLEQTSYQHAQTNYQHEQTNYEHEQTNYELEQTNYQLEQTNYQLENTDHQLEQPNYQLGQSNYQIEQANYQLEQTNYQLEPTNYQLEQTNEVAIKPIRVYGVNKRK